MTPLRLRCIACDALARPVYLAAAHSPHIVDVTLQQFGLHVTPKKLRKELQTEIDSADQAGIYDAVALAYGLCGKATDGLRAGKSPLVIPRAHDCITLFLGGRARYQQEFETCPGTYWYVRDYVERGASGSLPLSIGANTATDPQSLYGEYVEKYGKDNADYLVEAMGAWQSHYERAAYIDLGGDATGQVAEKARSDAQTNNWRFESLAGDMVLIKRLLDGSWDEDFLVLQPGEQIEMIGGDEIIRAI